MRDETKNRKPFKDIDNVQVKHSFPPDETVQPTDIEQTENNDSKCDNLLEASSLFIESFCNAGVPGKINSKCCPLRKIKKAKLNF